MSAKKKHEKLLDYLTIAKAAGGDAFGDGAFEPDSPLRGILGGGGFCTFPCLRRRRAPLKPVGARAVEMCENRARG